MEYAQLRPGPRFAPLHSLLYYSQRVTTRPVLRRLVVRALTAALRLRHGAGRELHAGTETEAAALVAMAQTGYTPLGHLLNSSQCDEIHAWLQDKPLTDRDHERAPFTLAQAPDGVRVADYHLNDVIGCPHLLALANSPQLLGLAARHMRCKPTISALGLRWSFPVPGNDSDLQAFHRDSEDWRYLKVLVYLTDVDLEAGPHVYLQGSHLTQAPVRLRFYSDREIVAAYGADQLLTALGTRGFCFAVDTAGIHKGTAPRRLPRLMLQIQYSLLPSYAYQYEPAPRPESAQVAQGIAPLFDDSKPYDPSALYDPYVNRLIVQTGR